MARHACPRCLTGVDDDGDGNCGICCRLSDLAAAQLAIESINNTIKIIGAALMEANKQEPSNPFYPHPRKRLTYGS